jgi:hypothetical protein
MHIAGQENSIRQICFASRYFELNILWKCVRKNIHEGILAIELYNLETDTLEHYDNSEQHPEILQRMEEIMKLEHKPSENEKFKFEVLGDDLK